MIYTDMTRKAMEVAYKMHIGQYDGTGTPFIYHPIHMAEEMPTELSCTIALLHDVEENTGWRIEDLTELGFPKEVTDGLRLLAHGPDADYWAYIRSIKESGNAAVIAVKISDVIHNGSRARYYDADEEREQVLAKYAKALAVLEDRETV